MQRSESGTAQVRKRLEKDMVVFRGHRLVMSAHPTTIEVTTEEHLTENGDCIIGVAADKGCAGLSPEVKEGLRRTGSPVTIKIVVGALSFQVRARGDSRLQLTHPHDIVIRKSDFASDRTLAVHADSAARDLPRELVRALKDPEAEGILEIEVG